MKRIWALFSLLLIFLNIVTFHAREVDKKKLKDFINMDLEFVNYRGPYDSTDTYQQIVGIGEFLAKNLVDNKANYYDRYYVNRYIDREDEKSSSDVFIIASKSSLDSILNLRRILTGYLMEGFKYGKESAELLAKAITIYNAAYRGDLDYYNDAYINSSLTDLSKNNVGLSRVYSQWAGKTHIFIPLKRNILSGDIESDVDLDKIVTEKVLASLLSENEVVGTNFARDLTDIQGDMRDVDQEKIDIESNTLKSIDDELTETIDNLREQLERATDDTEKKEIEKQIDDKITEKNVLKNKTEGLKKSQKKLDSSQEKLDKQRDVVKDRIQKDIDKGNKNKNLPKPGDINSPKVDEKLQLIETIEELENQLEKTTDDAEKKEIDKQIRDKMIEKNALESNLGKLKGVDSGLNKQKGPIKDKLQSNVNQEKKKDNLLSKPKDASKNDKDVNQEKKKDNLLPKPKDISKNDKDVNQEKKKDNLLPKPKSTSKSSAELKSLKDLAQQLRKATDDAEKKEIEKQVDDKVVKENALESNLGKLKGVDNGFNKQKGPIKDKLQSNVNQEKKKDSLSKPKDISKSNEKLKSAEELKKQLEKATANVPKNSPNIANNRSSQLLPNKSLNAKEKPVQSEDMNKLPLKDKNTKPVFLEILNPSTNLGVLRLIDSDTEQVGKDYQYGIRRYGVYEREDDLVAIKLCSGIAKLQVLSKTENLKVKSQAGFELSRDSSLFVDSEMILVVVKDNNVWKLAKFSSNDLSKFILSEEEVLPFTNFTVNANYVYLQDASKSIITLDLNTLEKVH
ncbi:P83/100 family protein [Borrelia persica]|uniref:P83/100 family protein n=1 Tax=Borrelia persica TaxID=44448 RepID=UPI000463E8F3|nr:P83/100 family protein [Borrelia persica]